MYSSRTRFFLKFGNMAKEKRARNRQHEARGICSFVRRSFHSFGSAFVRDETKVACLCATIYVRKTLALSVATAEALPLAL